MAYEKPFLDLKLTMEDVILVKPSKPTPSSVISLSTIDNRPELNSLCQTIHIFKPPNNTILIDDPQNAQNDPALVIKEALSKALFYYYPLAGRLVKHADGKLRIHCNAYGVPFLEAIANCKLSCLHYLDGSDTENAKHLAFDNPFHEDDDDENGYQYPLGIKVTKFLCGGFTVGIGASHAVFDGIGGSQFFQAMAELASGKSEPSVKPVWERERLNGSITEHPLLSPMDEASAAVSPYLPTKTLVHECFKVDSESIKRLKKSLMKEISYSNNINYSLEGESFTSFEALGAYVWRSRTRALKLNYDGKTSLAIVVGLRRNHSLIPPLPEGYYGNAFVDPKVVLTVKELNEKPLSHVVKMIKETKKLGFSKEYIRNAIDTKETKIEHFDYQGIGASMVLSSWMHLGMLENMNKGWAKPVNMVPAPCNMFGTVGVCIFSPPSDLDPSMNGGVRIFVSLPNDAMPMFKEEMEALMLVKP
ncbi:spermidine coumaroyl-CoA acyltransferase-like [Arachis stenosperma]|uniref:spermidine coumaroyl-CoA acyltransferase-like n=1 Tax=Arachis stenosperma TaxID=217475 RepID=UPI0025ACBE22|nr:spermidine coumaroyl-CoA acyltransferase-like [Arachis stenosperma]